MDYYNEIKNKLVDNELYSKVKDYSKERYNVITYFEIGRLLCEVGGKYGDNIIGEYLKKLVMEVGKKYNRRTLFRMKQFYTIFSDEKVSTMWTQLASSHIRLLFGLDYESINYYIHIVTNKHISVRELECTLKSNEYGRLSIEVINKLMNKGNVEIKDLVPNPILIKNSYNHEVINEKILEELILENIPSFLKELGNGFTFVDNEYKIKINDRYNYIDLLLFNYEFNCFVVVELKVTELKKEHIRQIQVYMNYIDDKLRNINQGKTIGIIICKQDNKYIIKYCSDDRIIARKYELVY